MIYKVAFRERAAREYVASVLWYKERSPKAAESFVRAVDQVLEKISTDPRRYRNTYRQFYEVGLKTYPFAIVYFIDEEKNQIIITSLFHYKRNPRKKFKDDL